MPSDSDSSDSFELDRLGWTDFFARQLAALPAPLVPARVVGGGGTSVRVIAPPGGPRLAPLAGRLLHDSPEHPSAARPVVGDWVGLREPGGAIAHVFDRRSCVLRKHAGRAAAPQAVAANVDTVFVVTSLNSDFNPRRIERYLAVVLESGADPVIVLSKADLCPAPLPFVVAASAVARDCPVLVASARTGAGLDALRAHLGPGRTAAVVGSSGVGKSALTNALLGSDAQREGAIRAFDERGRHTTAHRELFALPEQGGLLIDTPGMRELGLWTEGDGLAAAGPRGFDEIGALAAACRFRDCAHAGEPGCAVTAAIESGELDRDRLASFRKLRAEQRHLEARADPRVTAEAKRKHRALARARRKHPHR